VGGIFLEAGAAHTRKVFFISRSIKIYILFLPCADGEAGRKQERNKK
jgi:hypothetical protein